MRAAQLIIAELPAEIMSVLLRATHCENKILIIIVFVDWNNRDQQAKRAESHTSRFQNGTL